jgi:hypothetical protein
MYIGLSVQIHGLPDDTDPETVAQIIREQIAEFVYTTGPVHASNIVVDIEETAGGKEKTHPV